MFIDQNPRIAVVGPTGCGKTTLALRLARSLDLQHIDADGLFWGPDWTPVHHPILREQLVSALAAEAWITDGNIGRFRDIQLPRITTLVWLDYPLRTSLPRLLQRTLRRVLTRQIVHGGNRESFSKQFLSRDSVFAFALRRHAGLRQHYEELIESRDAKHLRLIRLASPRQTRRWLCDVIEPTQPATEH
ncbi:MAG: adenylate kinase [Gemmatimonadetes bacterium]|jgi:adenylate kinase family enzyme|nr:adenylate kinase [Gemmatimonadota bacterium]MBT7859856.1 adenylate kinase [Gemmatimonadota bacterium]